MVSASRVWNTCTAALTQNTCADPEGWGPISTMGSGLTPCFVDGPVMLTPVAILAVCGPWQIYSLFRTQTSGAPTRKNWTFWTKAALLAFQIIRFLLLLSNQHFNGWNGSLPFLSPFLTLASIILVAVPLHYLEYYRSRIPCGSLLFFWLLSPIGLLLKTYNVYTRVGFGTTAQIYLASTITALAMFIVEWAIPKPLSPQMALARQMRQSPLENADIFSRLTFQWMGPLMRQGYDHYLTEEDMPPLPKGYGAGDSYDDLEDEWEKKPNLLWAVWKAFGGPFMVGGFFKFIQDILAFVQPRLLALLIKFVKDYQDKPEDNPLSKGLVLAFAMFAVSIIQTAALHQYFQRAFDTGMKIKAGLTAAIYRKSLKAATRDKSTGDVVNLMSVDTQRLQDVTQYGQIIWSGPFQIILCLLSLHDLVGNSMWAGVATLLIMIPINAWIAKKQKTLQQAQMKYKDHRTRLTSEILTNMKSLKLYGWEIPFIGRLNRVRNDEELENLKRLGKFSALASFPWQCAPFLVSCTTFAVFVKISDKPLSTDIVFPALALFNLLGFPLAVIPMVITAMIEASVAINRLESYLKAPELQSDAVTRLPRAVERGENDILLKGCTFLWERTPQYKVALDDISLQTFKGDLACIVGKVGAGKSSLLQAILGDLYRECGTAQVKGRVAYVAQVPWIMNATVKDNILFGSKYDESFYEQTINACALVDDLAILPDGDQTQVGEKGISLSGGQKARLSLARAVYARADVYLLDDPLSAVDEHVGRHIIDNVLGDSGLLASKTKVLATNSISVLSHADSIMMLSAGKIVETGKYVDVMAAKGPIFKLLNEFGRKKQDSDTLRDDSSNAASVAPSTTGSPDGPSSSSSIVSIREDNTAGSIVKRRGSSHTLRRSSTASFRLPNFNVDSDERKSKHNKENMEQGKVKWSVYLEYAKASNIRYVILFMSFLVLAMALTTAGNVWLKHWSEVNTKYNRNPHIAFYLGIYLCLGLGASFVTVIQTFIMWMFCIVESAKKLHHDMLVSVVRAPMSFFETTPLGRIINRFSNDINKVDQVLGRTFVQFFSNTIKVLFTLIVISWSTPPFILFILPLLFLYIYYQRYYLRTSRELKRLDSVSRSPIFAHFQETLGGVSTIRAYSQQSRFNFVNEARVDQNMEAYFPSVSANRWLAVRLEFIGSIIILAAASFSVLQLKANLMTPGIIGLSMSYALSITQSLNWIVRMTVEVETNIVSVERILEYSNLKPEAPEFIPDKQPGIDWPEQGGITFHNYSTRYRAGLDLILKQINLEIKPREKIGIVGRTGAGKSSLTLALFRIIEAAEGFISIDGVDTSQIGLHDLRTRLAIIPQDSQAFEGTLRDNLDPNNDHSDSELWRVLELSHLKNHVVDNMEGGLDAKVKEGGSNFSVGQRQLMCLARALLTPTSILVLDEATAAVDVETDKIIQETIRTEFKNRTILTIAHRLNTILDSDKIVVLNQGEIAEFDTPAELLKRKDSLFYSLCKQGGFVDEE
jgi:ATP-binding cassette subfamily C (CFTR/MRP) protein 1